MASTFTAARSRGYDRRATRLLAGLHRTLAAVADAAAAPDAAVLDAGTGPGALLTRLADRRPDLRLHGLDSSPHMIDLARGHLGARAELTVGDVAALPYPDRSFDLALSSLSLHEWPDPAAGLAELARVLRPGGRLTIVDFRWLPAAPVLAALRAVGDPATVRRTPLRPPRYPVAPYARFDARRSG
ncbi:class I SAM-dependent methyltransferase [Nocardia jiangsuensis]|uniref:Class I SAM-dependent methyltransferase n=1 Tax=Nocardia jiangsuensis TaxID=1691563 RepID=A0ABV8DMV1_9NOCA